MKKYLVGTLLCIISLFFSCEEPNEPKKEYQKIYTIKVFELPFFDVIEYDEIHIIEFDENNKRVCKNRIEKLSLGEEKTFIAKTGVKQLKIYFHSDQSNTFRFQEELLLTRSSEIELVGKEITGEEYFEAILGQ